MPKNPHIGFFQKKKILFLFLIKFFLGPDDVAKYYWLKVLDFLRDKFDRLVVSDAKNILEIRPHGLGNLYE